MAENDDYTEGDATPSQAALDAQIQHSATIEQAGYLGQIGLARTQVAEAVAEGADATKGRELLGRLDDMAQFPSAEGNAEVYKDFKAFIKGGPVAQSPTPTPTPARRPQSKRYSDMTSEERGKMSSAEIDALTARQAGGEPQRPSPRVISKRMDR